MNIKLQMSFKRFALQLTPGIFSFQKLGWRILISELETRTTELEHQEKNFDYN